MGDRLPGKAISVIPVPLVFPAACVATKIERDDPPGVAYGGSYRATGAGSGKQQLVTGSRETMAEQIGKRVDPRMHSAEHIANQTMVRMFHCGRSFSTHLGDKKSKLDYHFERPLTDAEIKELERRVNEVVEADLPVTEGVVSREAGERDFDLERLPEGVGDTIRIIRIGDYDACPCIGLHVKTTREIGRFRVVSTSFEDGVLRVRYKLSIL
jgi:alanyl-tRNA synthetase